MIAVPLRPAKNLHWLILGATALTLLGAACIPGVRGFMVRGFAAMTAPDPDITRAFVGTLGWGGPLALLLAFVVQAVLPLIPALVLVAVSVKAYGAAQGLAIVYLGTLLGAAAGYGLGRTLGDSVVQALAGEKARQKAQRFAQQYGLQGVTLVRMMPILPAEVMNLVAGAAGMGFRPFMFATALGALPVTLLVVWLSGDLHRLILGLALFSALAALGATGRALLQRRRFKQGAPAQDS